MMGNRATITKERIAQAAWDVASARGLAGLGVREVAQECGVSVGSVYNYYPTKADLVADVVDMFWQEALAQEALHPRPGEGFLPFCRRLAAGLEAALGSFRGGWVGQFADLDPKSLAAARARERTRFAHIERGLASLAAGDASLDREALTGPLDPAALGTLMWRGMLASLRSGEGSPEALFSLAERALARD